MTEHVKTDYENAIDAYVEAERDYKQHEEAFLSGEVAAVLAAKVHSRGAPWCDTDVEWIKREFQSYGDLLKNKLEDVNIKLNEAKNAFRQAVVLGPTQQRGPGGSASSRSYGPLTTSSVTHRYFDPDSLLRLAAKYGILDRLMSLTSFDKEGKEYPLVKQSWEIDYDNVYKWLKEQNQLAIIDGSYDEKEGTPRVEGAKPLAFLGQKLK